MQILNTIPGAEIVNVSGWLFVMPVILAVSIGLLLASAEKQSGTLATVSGAILLISIIILSTVNFHIHTGKYNPTKYEVNITDKNYIIDATKYKIVDKRGEIIILEEVKE